MLQVEDRVSIGSSPGVVFRFASRPQNMPRWIPSVVESRLIGHLRPGATVVQRVQFFGRQFETRYTVAVYEPPVRVAYTSLSGPMDIRATMEFEPVPDGTAVRWSVLGDCRGFVRVPRAVLMGRGRHEMRAALEALRRLLDAEATEA